MRNTNSYYVNKKTIKFEIFKYFVFLTTISDGFQKAEIVVNSKTVVD